MNVGRSADVRLHAHGEQQLQQGIAIFFSIGDIAQIQLRCDFTQLCFIGRERVNFQMALKRLLIGDFPPVGTPAPAAADRPPH